MAKGHKRLTRLTEAEFNHLKQMQDLGVTQNGLARVANRSVATINSIYRAEDFADYKARLKATYERTKHVPAESVAEAQEVEDALNGLGESNLLKAIPELVNEESEFPLPTEPTIDPLERIACALERLADAWEASPKRRIF